MRRLTYKLILAFLAICSCVPREPRLYLIPHPATSQPAKLPAGTVNV